MSKHKSIIMTAESVLATLAGRKTQTRRVVEPQPNSVLWNSIILNGHGGWADEHGKPVRPRYQPGDIVYVKEAWQHLQQWKEYGQDFIDEIPKGQHGTKPFVEYKSDNLSGWYGRWRSPIFMPKWASRCWTEITGLRAERLQAITEQDAFAEGIELEVVDMALFARDYSKVDGFFQDWWDNRDGTYADTTELARRSFQTAWDVINAKRGFSWESNPYVWVYEYRVTQKPENL